ncbi:MAG: transglutaminase domain-containing protein [Oscillospiraceae bacterium]|nr:transglutaminase domain-containing protein [Oscillospiraceae bacterium]
MKNKRISDVVLVYDRYYTNKPNPVALAAKRVLLCCAVTVCAMMFVISQYTLPVNSIVCAVLSAVFAAAFSLLFIFVRKRFAIPAFLIIAGTVIWLRWESFSDKITYFTDAIWLVMDGRFVSSTVLIEHYKYELVLDNPVFLNGVMFGTVLMIMLFAMITAAGMFVKPHTLPSFLTWIVLWVPVFISERFTFNWWIIPSVALYMGAFASSVAYLEGLTLRAGKGGSYSNAASLNERSFINRLAKSPYIKRVEMKSAYYSKYFSLSMYAAAVFAVIGILTSVVLRDSQGIDYTKLYEFVTNIGKSEIFPSPGGGIADGYFTEPFDDSSFLTITSPGNSNREILKVTNPGSVPVYLRGDYGINLVDNYQWDTPVNNEPILWSMSGNVLRRDYRPAEMRILQSVMQRGGYVSDTIDSINITVEYLYDTDVVFLPAYTEDYSYYDNQMFDIYGDFVARVNSRFKKIDRVECTAMVAKFSNQDGNASESDLEYLKESINAVDEWDFNGVMNSFLSEYELVEPYRNYINSAFLSISEDDRKFMISFLASSGMMDTIHELYLDEEISEREKNYRIADVICTYLVNNYTYSLDAEVDKSRPIESFLTETKSGHCALYATSMTLMLRSLGIPARYCTGFVAPPSGGTPTVLRSKNLHAWCEVYLDELGWVTFDPTSTSLFSFNPGTSNSRPESSGSSSGNSSSEESSEPSSSEHSRESSDSESRSSGSGQSSGNDDRDSSYAESEKQSINILPYILIILLVAAVIALVLLVMHGYRTLEKRARKALRRYCRERKANIILDKIIALLEVGGLIPKNGELPEQFYRRAETTLRCAFTANKDMLEAVAFGKRDIHDTECEGMARLLEQLYNALEAKLGIFEKIKLRRTVL